MDTATNSASSAGNACEPSCKSKNNRIARERVLDRLIFGELDCQKAEEIAMRRGLGVLAVLTAISSVGLVSIGQAAELELSKRYVSRPDCDHSGCREWRGKRARCPDRFSCYPLWCL